MQRNTRTRIRLIHSLAAGEEINTMLPNSPDEFEYALAHGGVSGLKEALRDAARCPKAGPLRDSAGSPMNEG